MKLFSCMLSALKFIKYLLFGLYDGGDKKLKSERKLKHIKLLSCTLLGHRFLLLASLRFYQSFFLTFVSAIARQRVKIWQTSYKREGKLPKVFQFFITSSAARLFARPLKLCPTNRLLYIHKFSCSTHNFLCVFTLSPWAMKTFIEWENNAVLNVCFLSVPEICKKPKNAFRCLRTARGGRGIDRAGLTRPSRPTFKNKDQAVVFKPNSTVCARMRS